MESQAQLSLNIALGRQSFKILVFEKRRGALAPAYSEQHLHGVKYKRGSANSRGPN